MASTEPQATLNVEVCYAHGSGVWRRAVAVPEGANVGDALDESGFRQEFPGVDPVQAGLGVYGVKCDMQHVLHDGDRVEVYRPLVFDPKESRRRRALHRTQSAGKSRGRAGTN